MRRILSYTLCALVALLAIPADPRAQEAERRLEISDVNGYPIQITVSGSYLLTPDLTATPGDAAIEISADCVTIGIPAVEVVASQMHILNPAFASYGAPCVVNPPPFPLRLLRHLGVARRHGRRRRGPRRRRPRGDRLPGSSGNAPREQRSGRLPQRDER